MTDQFDDFNLDDDDEDGNTSQDSDESKDGAASGDDSDEASGTETARKLQSERDKERARANKAEAELKALKAKPSASDKSPFDPKAFPPEVREWLSASRENLRETLFNEDARLKAFGFSPELIQGDTPAAMRASAKTLIETVDKMESQIRDSVLQEHGFDPQPRGEERTPRKSFGSMSDEEFEKEMKRALGEL